jgi:2-methylcitrate dehydratase PrpD
LRDPDVSRVSALCTLEATPDLTALFRQGARPAAVEVKTRRGTFRREVLYPKGDPRNPMSWDDVELKFMQQAGPVLDSAIAAEIVDRTKAIETEADMRAFAALLGGDPARR